jgi:hypothetical protein
MKNIRHAHSQSGVQIHPTVMTDVGDDQREDMENNIHENQIN